MDNEWYETHFKLYGTALMLKKSKNGYVEAGLRQALKPYQDLKRFIADSLNHCPMAAMDLIVFSLPNQRNG